MRVFRDICILAASIGLAILVVQSGVLEEALEAAAELPLLGPFLAGALYTSIFTVALGGAAVVQLAEMGTPMLVLALVGALGATVADLVIFKMLKFSVADHMLEAVSFSRSKRLKLLIRRSKARLAGTLIGGMIVASPFPDEFGLLLMGLSRTRTSVTLLITYLLNALGIWAIAAIATRS